MILMFNGPPRSGKDTAVNAILKAYPRAFHLKLSAPIKRMIRAMYNLTDLEIALLEDSKDHPQKRFQGYSYRQMQISLSERWAKPFIGSDVWTDIAIKDIKLQFSMRPEILVLISDVGFQIEYDRIYAAFNYLVPVWLCCTERNDCTFENDSRGTVTANTNSFVAVNDGDQRQWEAAAVRFTRNLLQYGAPNYELP